MTTSVRTKALCIVNPKAGQRHASAGVETRAAVEWVVRQGDATLGVQFAATNLAQETAGFIQGFDAYRDEDIAKSNANPEAYRDAYAMRLTGEYARPLGNAQLSIRPFVRHSRMDFLQHFLIGKPLEENGQDSLGVITALQTVVLDDMQLLAGIDLELADGFLKETQDGPATDGPPPANAIPRVADRTLVAPDKLAFPKLPGVNVATTPHKAYRADYGPDFIRKGVVTIEPPRLGTAYPILVPQVDADGNELAGIRVPELSVPVATYTGWNLFNERSGPTNVVSSMQGSFIPLARTRADRERTSDPRQSVVERYRSRDEYLALIGKAAQDLVQQGYLLKDDVARIVDQAGTRWDFVVGRAGTQ